MAVTAEARTEAAAKEESTVGRRVHRCRHGERPPKGVKTLTKLDVCLRIALLVRTTAVLHLPPSSERQVIML